MTDFNPRPREEGDTDPNTLISKDSNFNPRPREEGDQAVSAGVMITHDFNPRPREEGDIYFLKLYTA